MCEREKRASTQTFHFKWLLERNVIRAFKFSQCEIQFSSDFLTGKMSRNTLEEVIVIIIYTLVKAALRIEIYCY